MQNAPVNDELLRYLQALPPINPVKSTMKDSSVLYGIFMGVSTITMAASGFLDETTHIIQADTNWFRLTQGIIATANVGLTTALAIPGRYQTYSDMADIQNGIDPEKIMARAAEPKTIMSKAFNWSLKNAFNINAIVSLPLCGLMLTSGITSGRPGESITASLLLLTYLWQLKKEKYNKLEPKEEKVSTGQRMLHILNFGAQSSMLMPVFLNVAKSVPMAINAFWVGDYVQGASFVFSVVGLGHKANTTKDGIGRAAGSIISADTENGTAVARSMIEGRIKYELSMK